MSAEILSFETGRPAERIGNDDALALVVDVEGYEGPLDLLLALARQQKVDLSKISILALADQYLVFIEAARKIRLELAADYLVMAAWLAFLKSRLLLPEPATPDGPSAGEMATALANRLPTQANRRHGCARIYYRYVGADPDGAGARVPARRTALGLHPFQEECRQSPAGCSSGSRF
ncbi:MAG: hypothetical protein NTAFB05_11750 [Nitrobacter sp.]